MSRIIKKQGSKAICRYKKIEYKKGIMVLSEIRKRERALADPVQYGVITTSPPYI